jgi:hypothetical protein
MSSYNSNEVDGGTTPLARPGIREPAGEMAPLPPLDLGLGINAGSGLPSISTAGPFEPSHSPQSPISPRQSSRNSEPGTPFETSGMPTSLAASFQNNFFGSSALRNRKGSLVPEHIVNRRAESPLPDDVQPSDLQQRELRYRHMSLAGGLFGDNSRNIYSRSPDYEDRPPGFSPERRKTVGSVSTADSHSRRLDDGESEGESDTGDESRPLLGGQINESPTLPPQTYTSDSLDPAQLPGPRQVSFVSEDVHNSMVMADVSDEPQFGIDFTWLEKYLAEAKEKNEAGQPSPRPEATRRRTGSTTGSGKPERKRTGSSVFRGVRIEPGCPKQT